MEKVLKKSYWLETAYKNYTPRPPLSGDKTYDFVIIGAGFTGLSAAYFLLDREPNLKVALVESQVAGFGASGRNDGFNMTLLGENILQLERVAGTENARVAHHWAVEAVETVRGLVEKHSIDCDYEHNGFLQIGTSSAHVEKIKREAEVHRQFGTDAKFLTAEQTRKLLPSTPVSAGMLDPHCGILNPAKYVRSMRDIVIGMGADLYENSPVLDVEEGKTIKVKTADGSIKAPHGLLATNAFSAKLGYFKYHVFPLFTYIVMTDHLTDRQMEQIGWQGRWGIETASRFVHYFRLTADNRITIGGGNAYYYFNYGTDQDRRKSSFRQLEEDLAQLFPPLRGVKFTHRWGGPVACTFDFFPITGYTGDHDNLYYSTGYTGHGVSLANASGKIIRDLYFGEDTHRSKLFFINRRPLAFPPEPLLYPAIGGYTAYLRLMDSIDSLRRTKVVK